MAAGANPWGARKPFTRSGAASAAGRASGSISPHHRLSAMPNFRFLYLLPLVLIFACRSEPPEPTLCERTGTESSINRILPLGASRVEGARPVFESYRYELWKLLVEGGWTFDYLGTRCDEADYAEVLGRTFDAQHEGRGGWTSGQILAGLPAWLAETGPPDLVLFSSPGGNDGLSGLSYEAAIANINAIIDTLQSANPAVTILIEQMAPASSTAMTPELTTFFEQIQEDVVSIAEEQSTVSSEVIPVDMVTGFSDALLADDVHYNQAGAAFVAQRYYQVLAQELE